MTQNTQTMKFAIERTSDYNGERRPCEEAILVREGSAYVDPLYHIEIDSLEALVALMKREGEIIIKEGGYNGDGLPVIEIYDTYRE